MDLKPFYVRIESCTNEGNSELWYTDYVGKVFLVKPSLDWNNSEYQLVSGGAWIKVCDATVLKSIDWHLPDPILTEEEIERMVEINDLYFTEISEAEYYNFELDE